MSTSRISRRECALSVGASLYYIVVSVLLTSSNKLLFDRFPVVDAPSLVLGQSLTAFAGFVFLLGGGRFVVPKPWTWPRRSLLLYFIYLVAYATTIITALLALSLTSMVMCNTLRRTSIIFVVIIDAVMYRTWPSYYTVVATFLTVLGALHAARGDLRYHPQGYLVAFLANVSSSIYLVMVRPVRDSMKLTNLQLQFLNTLFITPVLAVVVSSSKGHGLSIRHGLDYSDPSFMILFISSCLLAVTITHATYVSTTMNNAVTHVIAAVVKDGVLFIVSMLVDAERDRSKGKLIGVVLSLLGSVVYAVGKTSNRLRERTLSSHAPERVIIQKSKSRAAIAKKSE